MEKITEYLIKPTLSEKGIVKSLERNNQTSNL